MEARNIVGRAASEGAPPGKVGVEACALQIQRTLATGEGGTTELQVPHPNGELRVHSVVISAEFDAAGVICGALAVGRDITEQVLIRQPLVPAGAFGFMQALVRHAQQGPGVDRPRTASQADAGGDRHAADDVGEHRLTQPLAQGVAMAPARLR